MTDSIHSFYERIDETAYEEDAAFADGFRGPGCHFVSAVSDLLKEEASGVRS